MENPQNTFPCDCGAGQVVLKTALRSKTNVGRLYYSCPNSKGKDFGCGFFRWVDESQEAQLMIARRHEDSAAIQQVSDQLDGLLVEDEG
ncbi:hypothetical protein E3N88_42875 [Mikania micrantha]|uniref:GRF-type domain-containing protein n=1 Tax=Mikania micrantha TaxID=192012 RepID=A0A5N6LGJ9_9ASTR|nr:hypothetical protein E3N88_42875 [Mikania micrantha]